ncbi:MAG: hemolysin family protein [Comamonadaceae bacterium]|nr:hemolysin family protein [Burkholderiales bacterium]MEB2348363.1 hemolysin family protein [Comamonadaceae bacterium]
MVEIAVLVALIVLNGLFAMSELALVSARRARLQKLIDAGDAGAIAAAKLGEEPTRFLSTIQIGITSIGVLNGIVGESALARPLAGWLTAWGMEAKSAGYLALGLAVVVITYFSIVVGELVPKRLGQSQPELVARFVARPIDWLARATRPFVRLLTLSTEALLRLLGVHQGRETVTEDEIHAMLAEGTSAGVIERDEHQMVRNVFRLDERQIGSLMVPRADVVFLDVLAPFEHNLACIERSSHAHFPVVRGGMEHIMGVLRARQWLTRVLRDPAAQQLDTELLQPPLYVPETIDGMELLHDFRRSGVHMAFVVDEYGEVQGIVTVQDLVEAITGEFKTHDPGDAWATQRPDGSWLLDGHIPVPELKDCLGLASLPEEDKGRYQTLSGMLMLLTGKLPTETDVVQWAGWRFEIVDMDGKTIDKVLATRVADGPLIETPPPASQ